MLGVLLRLLLLLVFLAFPTFASAQGFMVQPMRLDVIAPAGKVVELPVEIRNTSGANTSAIELRLADLTQVASGAWTVIDPTKADSPAPSPYSSLSWATLQTTRLEIAPLEPAKAVVRLAVPPNARGVYFAALLAETVSPEGPGVSVRVRFLIPVIVEIEGRPVRQRVALSDLDMSFNDGTDGTTPTTTARMIVTNDGRTFSRIRGLLTVERLSGEQWRSVTQIEIAERSILPGLTLNIPSDLSRRLPSGQYRLRAELFVDGRRVAPLLKELDFSGDPTVDELAYDTALGLEPSEVTMEVVPGATRTTTVTISNPGTEPVQVAMASSTPKELSAVQMGDLRGSNLSAEPWTEIKPAEFTIRPGGRQNVRVISRVPKADVLYPNYYADLVLKGTYADGQSAGETHTTVHLANTNLPETAAGIVEYLALAEGDTATKYIVQSRLVNIGNVHTMPVGRVELITSQGTAVRTSSLSGEEGMLLPLAKRSYSAELELGGLDAGYYALRTTFSLGEENEVRRQQIVRIDRQELAGPNGENSFVPVVTVEEGVSEFPVDSEPNTVEPDSEAETSGDENDQ